MEGGWWENVTKKADYNVNKFSNDTVFHFVIQLLWIVQCSSLHLLNINYFVLHRQVLTKTFCEIGLKTKQIFRIIYRLNIFDNCCGKLSHKQADLPTFQFCSHKAGKAAVVNPHSGNFINNTLIQVLKKILESTDDINLCHLVSFLISNRSPKGWIFKALKFSLIQGQ